MLFDTLLLMSAGEFAYFGRRSQVGAYLGSVGVAIPEGVNPADFVVDLTYARDEARVVDTLIGTYASSEEGMQMAQLTERLGQVSRGGALTEVGVFTEEDGSQLQSVEAALAAHGTKAGTKDAAGAFAHPLRSQVYSLMRRAFTNEARASDVLQRIFIVPMLQYLFFGLIYLGTRGIGVEPTDDRRMKDFTTSDVLLEDFLQLIAQKRSFYFQVMSTAVLTESSVMGEAFAEQRAFRREQAAGAYSVMAYHLQWVLRLNFRAIYTTLIFGSTVYWFPAQVPNDFSTQGGTFFFFLVTMAVCATLGSALALLFISLIPDPEGAAGAHNAISAVLLQYSGYFLLPCLMPPLVNTAYFISFGKYGLEAMLRNEFGTVPYGTQWNLYSSVQQSLDPTLSRWTNLLILMVYPFALHLIALGCSILQTRPKSFWAPLEDWRSRRLPDRFPSRDKLARADPSYEGADAPIRRTHQVAESMGV